MPSNRLEGHKLASTVVALLVAGVLASPATAGPISDMLARHRQAKMTKLPPMDKPHTIKKIKDPYPPRTASLSQRFKQRFGLNRSSNPLTNPDPGLIKTSH
jgi:hypothetical protein